MHLAMIILPEKERRLPTPEELGRAGFAVSSAVTDIPGVCPGQHEEEKKAGKAQGGR